MGGIRNLARAFVAFLLLCGVPSPGAGNGPGPGARVPLIYCSDLFHPAMDPDDHFDLVTLFALKEFDVKAVILDNHIVRPEQDQTRGGGKAPLEQMMRIARHPLPWAIGLKTRLKTRDDKALDADPRFQAGVELMLKVLKESPGKVVVKLSTGTDFAVAFNRQPDLVRSKVRAVYLHAGSGREGASKEYNVTLDPIGYERVFETGVPLFWCPCFGPLGYESFFRYPDQSELFAVCAEPIRRFFSYAFARPDEDPIAYLTSGTPVKLPAKGVRQMWSPPTLAHAAGRRVYQRGAADYMLLTPAAAERAGLAGKEIQAFGFVPVRVTPARVEGPHTPRDNAAPGALRVEFMPPRPNCMIFRQIHPDYEKILNSCLKNLFAEFSRSCESD